MTKKKGPWRFESSAGFILNIKISLHGLKKCLAAV
jgi:hypothetical protein